MGRGRPEVSGGNGYRGREHSPVPGISPDGKRIYAARGQTVEVLATSNGELMARTIMRMTRLHCRHAFSGPVGNSDYREVLSESVTSRRVRCLPIFRLSYFTEFQFFPRF
jgi:hypothetical protein